MKQGDKCVYRGNPATIVVIDEDPGTLIRYDTPVGCTWQRHFGTMCDGESCEDDDWCDCRALATGLIKTDDRYDWVSSADLDPHVPLTYVNAMT